MSITPERRLDASFSRVNPDAGRIALLCQSGSIGEFLFLRMVERRLGVAMFASLGQHGRSRRAGSHDRAWPNCSPT